MSLENLYLNLHLPPVPVEVFKSFLAKSLIAYNHPLLVAPLPNPVGIKSPAHSLELYLLRSRKYFLFYRLEWSLVKGCKTLVTEFLNAIGDLYAPFEVHFATPEQFEGWYKKFIRDDIREV